MARSRRRGQARRLQEGRRRRAGARRRGTPSCGSCAGTPRSPRPPGRGQRGGAASTAFYLEALRLSPDNAAAHHYLTHSYETIGQIPLALEHGEAFARLAPAIPHSHHMWGHDLRRVGSIDDAIAAFRRTDELEKAYYAAESIAPGSTGITCTTSTCWRPPISTRGRCGRPRRRMREAEALPPVTEYLEFNQKALSIFLLGRGAGARRWRAADPERRQVGRDAGGGPRAGRACAPGPGADRRGSSVSGGGGAGAGRGSRPGGGHLRQPRRGSSPGWTRCAASSAARRESAEGPGLLKDVAARLRALPGPDAWIQALFRLEAIARLAREAGEWDLADYTARQMLEHDAAYGGSHLALGLVALERGDRATAEASAAAARCWGDADPDLPELAAVKAAAAR